MMMMMNAKSSLYIYIKYIGFDLVEFYGMVDMPQNTTKSNHIYLIYMYKEDLALNNLQWLIHHKSQIKSNHIY